MLIDLKIISLLGAAALGAAIATHRAPPVPAKSIEAGREPMHLDKPVNSTMRDDTTGGATLSGARSYLARQFQREAREHPGVKLVQHAIV